MEDNFDKILRDKIKEVSKNQNFTYNPEHWEMLMDKKKSNKKRILIEGPINSPFKGIADSYESVKDLDCEIWFVSNDGKPKQHWRHDKFLEKVPMTDMHKVYSSCDILLKMSISSLRRLSWNKFKR